MIKIFFHYTGSEIEKILTINNLDQVNAFNDAIFEIIRYGSSSMLGFDFNNPNHFLTFSNSQILQKKWAKENGISNIDDNWEIEILNQQLKEFQPDVIFTVNPTWFVQNIDKLYLRQVKCKAAWKASPISANDNYSDIDLGLSFNSNYLNMLKEKGVKNIENHQFNFNYDIRDNTEEVDKCIDLSFTGTYNDFMFSKRTHFLNYIFKSFFPIRKIRYFFNTKSRRFGGILPKIPLRFMPIYRQPVFLKDYLSVIQKSKIAFNCHSDITGIDKGNMRFFEVLGMKTFLLTDKGNYPKNLKDGLDYVGYRNKKDLVDKVKYFLIHEKEREEIASHGYESIKKHYNLEISSNRLEEIFSKYL